MRFNDYIKGVCRYKVKTECNEKLINRLRKCVSLKRIRYIDENTISFTCFFADCRCAEDVIKELGGEIAEMKKRGFPLFASKLFKRPGLILGTFLFVIVTAVSSNLVWDVRVSGNELLSEKEIERMMRESGLYEGMWKKQVNVKSIVNKVLIAEDALSWLSVNFDGTVAHVEVKEAKIGVLQEKKENVNLTASHSGIIMRVDALEGQAKVGKGDSVEKGNLLVSAFVDKRTGGSLLRGARGFVWAETERKYCVCVPLYYFEKDYSGMQNSTVKFSLLGKTVKISKPVFHKPLLVEKDTYEIDNTLPGQRRFPFDIEVVKEKEYMPKQKRRTEAQAVELAKSEALSRLYTDSPGFALVNTSEKHECLENKIVYTVSYYGVENIAVRQEFELS